MNRKSMYSLALIVSLIGLLSLSVKIPSVSALYPIITIKADGSVFPTPVNIATSDNVTYTFIGDINASIVVQRSNIVIDGSGWMLGGNDYAIIYGLNLTDVSNVTIRNLNVIGFGYGIHLESTTMNIILNNNITFNEGNIYLEDSYNNTIAGNTIANGAEAIQLHASSNNTISGNTISYNYYGVWSRLNSAENIISGNNITHSNRGIFLDDSSKNTMRGNRIAITSAGILSNNSLNNIITGNLITRSTEGISMEHLSRYNTIIGNSIDNNTQGIVMSIYSSSNIVVGNNITRNREYGVFLFILTDSTFYRNNFLGNVHHVGTYLPSVHVWDDGVEGNYWSNYTGVDLDHDGIGDIPHVIDANNTDYYPLMGLFQSLNASVGKVVNIISNSTVDDFEYCQPCGFMIIVVANTTPTQTHGFCRVAIPKSLMPPPYTVVINNGAIAVLHFNQTIHDNGTHVWMYFAYEHSTHVIKIIPELSPILILPLFMVMTLLTISFYKKKKIPGN